MAYGYYYPYQAMQGNQYQNNQYQNNQNGIITVRSIDEARMYPVAPGNSITFRDENAPYIYTPIVVATEGTAWADTHDLTAW